MLCAVTRTAGHSYSSLCGNAHTVNTGVTAAGEPPVSSPWGHQSLTATTILACVLPDHTFLFASSGYSSWAVLGPWYVTDGPRLIGSLWNGKSLAAASDPSHWSVRVVGTADGRPRDWHTAFGASP